MENRPCAEYVKSYCQTKSNDPGCEMISIESTLDCKFEDGSGSPCENIDCRLNLKSEECKEKIARYCSEEMKVMEDATSWKGRLQRLHIAYKECPANLRRASQMHVS